MRIPTILACALVLPAALAQTDRPLCLLFILNDQHDPRMLGVDSNGYGGVPASLTPSLDRIAAEGTRFTRAYCASPQCMPSRFSLLTGRFPHSHGLWSNGVWERASGELTLPALARRHGYSTATIGKHHLAWLDQSGVSATDHGFDRVQDLDDYREHCEDHQVPAWNASGNHWQMDGVDWKVGYTFNRNAFHPAGYFADQAIDFLEDRGGSEGDGKPFVLWLSFHGPHTPILPSGPTDPGDWAHRYHPFAQLDLPPNMDKVADTLRLQGVQAKYEDMSAEEHREALSYYYGLVGQIDHNIGRVLGRLDELGLADHTVVVFTADHGEFAAEMSCWTKGGGSYDCLTRVPLLIRSPGQGTAGQVAEIPTSGVDLFPTLVELLGLSPTPTERNRVDGRSLADVVLTGEAPGDWPEVVFSEFGRPSSLQHRMVATARDKYALDEKGGGQEEYFDLLADPWERTNLVADPRLLPRIGELRSTLAEWWGDAADHAPSYATTGDPHLLPARAKEPAPADGATQVPTDVDPGWLPATSAASQAVFLGTDPDRLGAFKSLPAMADRFNAGTLAGGTTYYWRVDGINTNGVKTGPVWSFETEGSGGSGGSGGYGHQGPGLAHSPTPPDACPVVPLDVVLTWESGAGTMAHDLWLGPEDGPLVRVLHGMPAARYVPPSLLGGRTYRWRVDGVDENGVTVGDEWTFTVDGAGLAGRARRPFPAHLASEVTLAAGESLHWKAGKGALEHALYLGTDFPLRARGRRADTAFDPGTLAPGRTYYWRVDELNDTGVRTGFTWRFTTRE